MIYNPRVKSSDTDLATIMEENNRALWEAETKLALLRADAKAQRLALIEGQRDLMKEIAARKAAAKRYKNKLPREVT